MKNAIFSGKEAKYNRLILTALFEKGRLSAYKLAKEIAKNDPDRKPKENIHHNAQKINSVLVRRNGRLAKLSQQEFIEKKGTEYQLTMFKGLCSALCLMKTVKMPGFDPDFDSYIIFPEIKKIIEIAQQSCPEAILEDYKFLREIALDQLEKGLNFELISNREFNVIANQRYQETLFQDYKKKGKKKSIWAENPEYRDAVLKFIDRLYNIAFKELEEVRLIKDKISADLKKEENKIE